MNVECLVFADGGQVQSIGWTGLHIRQERYFNNTLFIVFDCLEPGYAQAHIRRGSDSETIIEHVDCTTFQIGPN